MVGKTTSCFRRASAGLLPVVAASAVLLTSSASAQMREVISANVPRGGAPAEARSDQRDVLLMLDDSPVHVRLNLALAGVSLVDARRQYLAELMATLDKDGNGKLNAEEAAASPLLRKKERPDARKFLEGLKGSAGLTVRDVERAADRLGGGPIGYRQYPSTSQNDVEVFKLLDTDGSGMIDSGEMAAAGELVLAKDADDDDCVAFDEFMPPQAPMDPNAAALAAANPPSPVIATVADLLRDSADPRLPRLLVKKYDRNRDLQLDAKELKWPAERIKACDADGSGKLDMKELARLATTTPDLELGVELLAKGADGGLLDIKDTSGQRLDDASRLDYAKVSLGGAVVTFSLRNLDPIASAIDDAMLQFNLLDADANGYLDKDETAMRARFQQSLFGLIDLDGDDKLFADELKQYVRGIAAPAATTCRMNLYDTGYGFFMALDTNADGRVSRRERSNTAQALAQLDRDGQSGVKQDEPVRHFHVEFVRTSHRLFGASEELVAQTPAFQQRTATGPIWFQRMDKNNDGDLVWNEFLGRTDVFESLDADHDGLIDPQEAASYSATTTTSSTSQ